MDDSNFFEYYSTDHIATFYIQQSVCKILINGLIIKTDSFTES